GKTTTRRGAYIDTPLWVIVVRSFFLQEIGAAVLYGKCGKPPPVKAGALNFWRITRPIRRQILPNLSRQNINQRIARILTPPLQNIIKRSLILPSNALQAIL